MEKIFEKIFPYLYIVPNSHFILHNKQLNKEFHDSGGIEMNWFHFWDNSLVITYESKEDKNKTTKTKPSYQAFLWVLIDLIMELLDLIINPFDKQTEIHWDWLPKTFDTRSFDSIWLIIKSFDYICPYLFSWTHDPVFQLNQRGEPWNCFHIVTTSGSHTESWWMSEWLMTTMDVPLHRNSSDWRWFEQYGQNKDTVLSSALHR